MRLSNNINPDLLAVGISAFIITVCSALLYADYSSREGAGDAKQIGTITYKKKVAQRKYASQVVWEDLEQNTPVYNNDTIRTADLSEAIVNLADGTSINLDENSLILLASAGGGINIDFSHGSITANRAAGATGDAGQVTIKSKEAVVSLDKGDVKLSRTGDRGMDVTVTAGTAEIRTGAVEKTIAKDEKAVITEDRQAKVVRLNLKLSSPRPNENFVTTAAAMPVSFAWKKADGAGAVSLEIARDGGFARGIMTRPSAGTSHVENLPEGTYYWRIRAFNAATGAPEYSDIRKLGVIRDLPLRLLYPRNNEVMSYSVKPPIINLRWAENRLATEYIVEISRDPAFRRIERTLTTPFREISVDRLGAGAYYWRVKTRNAGVGAYGATSAASAFRIDRLAEPGPPVLIAPASGSRISSSMLGKNRNFMFSWTADSEVGSYDLLIARDDGFRDIAFRARITGNFHALNEGLQPGSYYWRVVALPRGDGREVASAADRFTVVAAGTVRPGAPRITGTADIDGAKRVTVRFPWTVSDFRGARLLELSRDRGFVNVVAVRNTMEDHADIDAIPPGEYYWRVRLYENGRSLIAESGAQPLYVGTRGELVGSAGEIVQGKTGAEIAREEAEFTRLREEAAKKLREEQALRRKEEQARREKEDQARREREEIAKKQQEEQAVKEKEELARKQREEIAGRQQAELERKQQENLARKQQQELALKQQAELERKQQQEFARKQQENLKRKQQEDLARKQQELARKQQAEQAQKQQQEQARKRQEEIDRRQQVDLARKQREATGKPKPVLTIVSSVKGSEIYIDSNLRGRDTVTITQEAGIGTLVEVKADGYVTFKQTVKLAPGEKKRIDARLAVNIPVYREKHPGRRTRWRTNLASTVTSRPVSRNNMIVATTKNGVLTGLTMAGARRWSTPLGSPARSTPATDNAAVYVVTVNGYLCSVNINTGALNWKKKVEGPLLFGAEPIVEKDRIYIATSYGMVQAFAPDGRAVWERNLEEGIFSSITYDDGLLYVGTDRSRVYALNARDGSVRWSCDTDGRIFTSSPKIYRGYLFVGCYSGSFYAIDARSGWVKWVFRANKPLLSAPAFHGDSVFFGSEDGMFYAVGVRSGAKQWEFRARAPILTGPEVFGNSVLVPSGNTVYALDAASGDLNWKEGLAAGINTPVTVVGNAAFVGLDNGEVVSLGSL